MRRERLSSLLLAALLSGLLTGLLTSAGVRAAGDFSDPDATRDALDKYRAQIAEDNPAELAVAKGAELWNTPAGPLHATLAACDLGRGPGVVAGAAAQLPRWFADTGLVMDLEARLVHCLTTLQGFDRVQLVRQPFAGADEPSTTIEALAAYVVDAARGARIDVPQGRPEEIAAYRRGRAIFHYRSGPYDFSCASCHGEAGRRIRLQELPDLSRPGPSAQRAFATWPAYRISQGALRTFEWRLGDCFRQQRWPQLRYLSPVAIDLATYLGVTAHGGTMAAPGLKR
jgi:sulfur-oxidizing protein SoxA